MPELSGFRGAPVTLLLTYTVLGGSFLANVAGPKLGAALSLTSPAQVLAARPEVWRLVTSSLLLCDDFGAALVASFLLYRLRLFERQMGSSKFAAFVCLGTAVDALARAAFLAVPGLGARGVAAGPFQVVMGLLPLYYWSVPCLHDEYFRLCGVAFTEKSFLYVVMLVLACSSGVRSLWPSLTGLAWGALYGLRALPLSRLRFPRPLRHFCRQWVLPLLQAAPPAQGGGAGTGGGGGGGGGGAAGAAPTAAAPPREDSIAKLVAMGFSREQAVVALTATGGNVDAAVERLVG